MASATVTVPTLGPECWMIARQLAESVCVTPEGECVHRWRIAVEGDRVTVVGSCDPR